MKSSIRFVLSIGVIAVGVIMGLRELGVAYREDVEEVIEVLREVDEGLRPAGHRDPLSAPHHLPG